MKTLKENMAKNRSLNKIGKEFDALVADMKKTAADWAKASGPKKDQLLRKMKSMTKEKKELQDEMERAVMDIDKDVALQVDERYTRIALTNAISRMVEQEIKSIIPNRSKRRLVERNMAKSSAAIRRRSLEYVQAIKKTISEAEWSNLQTFATSANGLTEAMSDSQIADLIAKASEEVLKGKFEIDPSKIDVGAIEKAPDDIDAIFDPGVVKKESRHSKATRKLTESHRLLTESLVLTAILSAPTLLKLLGYLVDWVGSAFTGSKETRGVTRVISRISQIARNTGGVPSKKELASTIGKPIQWKKGVIAGVTFEDDVKYIDAAYERIGKFVAEDNEATLAKAEKGPNWFNRTILSQTKDDTMKAYHALRFDPAGETRQPKTGRYGDHMLHIIKDASFDTDAGKWLFNMSHKLHDLYIWPLRVLIAGVMITTGNVLIAGANAVKIGTGDEKLTEFYSPARAWRESKKIANVMYAVIMAFIAIDSGIHAYEELGKGVSSTLEKIPELYVIAADSAKTGDMTVTTIEAAIDAATSAGEIVSDI